MIFIFMMKPRYTTNHKMKIKKHLSTSRRQAVHSEPNQGVSRHKIFQIILLPQIALYPTIPLMEENKNYMKSYTFLLVVASKIIKKPNL